MKVSRRPSGTATRSTQPRSIRGRSIVRVNPQGQGVARWLRSAVPRSISISNSRASVRRVRRWGARSRGRVMAAMAPWRSTTDTRLLAPPAAHLTTQAGAPLARSTGRPGDIRWATPACTSPREVRRERGPSRALLWCLLPGRLRSPRRSARASGRRRGAHARRRVLVRLVARLSRPGVTLRALPEADPAQWKDMASGDGRAWCGALTPSEAELRAWRRGGRRDGEDPARVDRERA